MLPPQTSQRYPFVSKSDLEDHTSRSSIFHSTTWRSLRPLSDILATPNSRARAREVEEARRSKARVDNAFSLVKDFSDGHHIGLSSRSKTLNESEYGELLDRIGAEAELDEHIWRRVRFNYSQAEKRFTIHMITRLHATCGAILSTEIHNLVKSLAQTTSDSVILRIIEGIEPVGSSEINPSAGPYKDLTKFRPDASFQFGLDFPELVVEVGWSQTKEDVEQNSTQYLRHFNDQIQTVIGINLNDIYEEQKAARGKWLENRLSYEKGKLQSQPEPHVFLDPQAAAKSAYFSVWRLDAERRAIKNRLFQQSFQSHSAGPPLNLSLKDFVCQADIDTICRQEDREAKDVKWPQIEISSERLCEIVRKGVVKYTNTYLRMVDKAWDERKATWIKEQEAAAEAERRREAVGSQSAERNLFLPERIGRLRIRKRAPEQPQ